MNTLTEGARNFVQLQLQPALDCLKNHHGGDIQKFVETWGKEKRDVSLTLSNFKKSCKGSGENCGE
jgi:hypothetical protein